VRGRVIWRVSRMEMGGPVWRPRCTGSWPLYQASTAVTRLSPADPVFRRVGTEGGLAGAESAYQAAARRGVTIGWRTPAGTLAGTSPPMAALFQGATVAIFVLLQRAWRASAKSSQPRVGRKEHRMHCTTRLAVILAVVALMAEPSVGVAQQPVMPGGPGAPGTPGGPGGPGSAGWAP
jgi:hypothetical protein